MPGITKRRQHSAEVRAKVALESLKGQQTNAEIGSHFKIHPTQVTKWRKQLIERASEIFSDGRSSKSQSQEELVEDLYKQIGKLNVELEWLKKKSACFD